MTNHQTIRVLSATFAAGLVSACGPQHIQPQVSHARVGHDQVVLLPDPDGGPLGRAIVSTRAGSVDLATARASTLVSTDQPPTPATELSEAEVARLFGEVLSGLPPPPRHFMLYFRVESDQLTEESRTLVPRILRAVKDRPAPDVLVVGHTDTTGPPTTNFELGLRRASMVRALLVTAGLDVSVVEVASHGESDLLVPTNDETSEPRNRRVEITVR